MGEGRELVPDGALPLVEAPCWFCSPSVSMAAEETDEASVSQTQDETNTTFSLCESLMDRGGKKPHTCHCSWQTADLTESRCCETLFTAWMTDVVLLLVIFNTFNILKCFHFLWQKITTTECLADSCYFLSPPWRRTQCSTEQFTPLKGFHQAFPFFCQTHTL